MQPISILLDELIGAIAKLLAAPIIWLAELVGPAIVSFFKPALSIAWSFLEALLQVVLSIIGWLGRGLWQLLRRVFRSGATADDRPGREPLDRERPQHSPVDTDSGTEQGRSEP